MSKATLITAFFLLGVGLLTVFFFTTRDQIPHTIIFVDGATNEPIADRLINVSYDPVCPSSPCHLPEKIFLGYTASDGSIPLQGHTTRDINRFVMTDYGSEYFFDISGYRFEPSPEREGDAVVTLTPTSENPNPELLYSENGRFSVEAAGYSGGYPGNNGPNILPIIVREGDQVIAKYLVPGSETQTATGAFPTVLGVTNDGTEVWGLSHIHGMCPCSLGLWTFHTKDGSITKYPALYEMFMEQVQSDYDFERKIAVGVVKKGFPPPPNEPWREELWMIDLVSGEKTLLNETDTGRITDISLSQDGSEVEYILAERIEGGNRFNAGHHISQPLTQ